MNLAEVHELQFYDLLRKFVIWILITNLNMKAHSWWIKALTIKAYDPGLTLMTFLYFLALKCSSENNSYYKALQGIHEFLPTVRKLTLSANHWGSSLKLMFGSFLKPLVTGEPIWAKIILKIETCIFSMNHRMFRKSRSHAFIKFYVKFGRSWAPNGFFSVFQLFWPKSYFTFQLNDDAHEY